MAFVRRKSASTSTNELIAISLRLSISYTLEAINLTAGNSKV